MPTAKVTKLPTAPQRPPVVLSHNSLGTDPTATLITSRMLGAVPYACIVDSVTVGIQAGLGAQAVNFWTFSILDASDNVVATVTNETAFVTKVVRTATLDSTYTTLAAGASLQIKLAAEGAGSDDLSTTDIAFTATLRPQGTD